MATISLTEARARVLAACTRRTGVETVSLAGAHGRILAEAVVSPSPWPTTDRSAMDGFAVRCGSGLPAGTRLPVVGQSLAGAPFDRVLAPGEAIRIMTGAVVPAGADAVVAVERTSGFGGDSVELGVAVQRGQNIRLLGSELAAGQRVLAPGDRLDAAAIGVLAVLGRTLVQVARRPVVAILATGDEVVPVEATPLPHQVRESNSWALAAQVAESGGVPLRLGIAPDEADALRSALRCGLEVADVLLTIGGVSKGTHDLVHGLLAELSVHAQFHGIELKPGKPTFFGTRDGGTKDAFVFGLPGNPASTFTVFDLLVRPLLLALCGADPGQPVAAARAGGAPWVPNVRVQAVPARLRIGADGAAIAELARPSPSGDPFGLLRRDGYAIVPSQQAPAPGAIVPFVGGAAGIELP